MKRKNPSEMRSEAAVRMLAFARGETSREDLAEATRRLNSESRKIARRARHLSPRSRPKKTSNAN
jgi:hypothetical protein